LVIVPQANLISKVKAQGKSIQYHGQVDKALGETMYNHFCDCVASVLYEDQCSARQLELPSWYLTWKQKYLLLPTEGSSGGSQQPPPASTPPERMFCDDTTKYGAWDEATGLPVKTADGESLTKSALRRLRKLQAAHAKRHARWKETGGEEGAPLAEEEEEEEQEKGDGPSTSAEEQTAAAVDWSAHLDSSFCTVVAGSFGKRQGLEFQSDMGPFCHLLQV
jgi:hypothetical protein